MAKSTTAAAASISRLLFLEQAVKNCASEVRSIREASTSHNSLLRELVDFKNHAATKAELHAAVYSWNRYDAKSTAAVAENNSESNQDVSSKKHSQLFPFDSLKSYCSPKMDRII